MAQHKDNQQRGYTLIILMVAITIMAIGLMVAVPIWQTQVQREKEEELIFRGKQYVEAIRVYQLKNPGKFPGTLDELFEKRFLRKPFKDPMTDHGEWNIILPYGRPGRGTAGSLQKVLVAPPGALTSLQNPQIIGVVSQSPQKSIMIYYDNNSYDTWLFFYGQDPEKTPEIVYYGQAEEDR